jgi:hypothetical protein
MTSRIITKKGSGAPLTSDLVHGELAVDTVNKRLYTEDAGGSIIEVGTNPSTIDINAGTIDGTVIGGSTAAAGTFTSLTATSNIDTSAGYLFGATNSYIYESAADTANLRVGSDGPYMILGKDIGGDVGAFGNSSGGLAFYSSNTEGMRLTSTGLGIGTSTDLTGSRVHIAQSVAGANKGITLSADGTSTNGYADFSISPTDTLTIQMADDIAHRNIALNPLGGNVGIGTSSPTQLLDVASTGETNAAIRSTGAGSARLFLQGSGGGSAFVISNANNLDLRTATAAAVTISTNNAERARIDSSGNVGIGTTSPAAKLEIGGAGEGIILASPDGTRYEITVANGGTLTVAAV